MNSLKNFVFTSMATPADVSEKNKKIRLLIVDDDEKFLNTISERLGLKDFEVSSTTEAE